MSRPPRRAPGKPPSAMQAKPGPGLILTSSPPSRQIGIAAGSFLCALVGGMLVPRNQPGNGAHDEDSANADQCMQRSTAGHLGQDEMPGKGQEYAEAEDLKGMLAAEDQGLEPGRFQPCPVSRQKAHRDRRQRQEMRKTQH